MRRFLGYVRVTLFNGDFEVIPLYYFQMNGHRFVSSTLHVLGVSPLSFSDALALCSKHFNSVGGEFHVGI